MINRHRICLRVPRKTRDIQRNKKSDPRSLRLQPERGDCLIQAAFVHLDELVPFRVRLVVDQLSRGIGVEPGDRPANTFQNRAQSRNSLARNA